MAKRKSTKKKTPKKDDGLPAALEVGDVLHHEDRTFEVTEIEAPGERERRYRVCEQVDDASALWLKQRSKQAADGDGGFGIEAKGLQRVQTSATYRLLPRVVAHFSEERGEFLILERWFGDTLGSRLELLNDPFDLAITFEQLFLTLSKLHRAGYVVTDLSPDSFVVSDGGGLQLVELGGLTLRNRVPVRPRKSPFVAPEVMALQPVDERSDIFAAGAMFAAAYLGHTEDSAEAWIERLRDELPLEPVITQILRGSVTDRDLRFLSVDEMRILLYQLKNEQARFPRPTAAINSTVGVSRFRYINEDSAGYQELSVQYQSRPQHVGFYCVADGMGGHELGERASQLAILGALQAFRQLTQQVPFERLREGLMEFALTIGRAASEVVSSGAAQFPGGARMGTTFTGVLVLNDEVALVHVGDSRALLVRDGVLQALSLDHSLVASLVRVGQMTEEEAAESDERNVLVRCIDARLPLDEGGFDSLMAVGYDTGRLKVQPGDTIVLLSDGVWGALSDERLLDLVQANAGPQAISDAIVAAAIVGGSDDNATALTLVWS